MTLSSYNHPITLADSKTTFYLQAESNTSVTLCFTQKNKTRAPYFPKSDSPNFEEVKDNDAHTAKTLRKFSAALNSADDV